MFSIYHVKKHVNSHVFLYLFSFQGPQPGLLPKPPTKNSPLPTACVYKHIYVCAYDMYNMYIHILYLFIEYIFTYYVYVYTHIFNESNNWWQTKTVPCTVCASYPHTYTYIYIYLIPFLGCIRLLRHGPGTCMQRTGSCGPDPNGDPRFYGWYNGHEMNHAIKH